VILSLEEPLLWALRWSVSGSRSERRELLAFVQQERRIKKKSKQRAQRRKVLQFANELR
jgi:hypothetical protein